VLGMIRGGGAGASSALISPVSGEADAIAQGSTNAGILLVPPISQTPSTICYASPASAHLPFLVTACDGRTDGEHKPE